MKKEGLFFGAFLSLISLVGFVKAQSTLSDIFSGIDPTLITLAILFVIFFAVLYFSTSKMFKGNKTIAAVISLALSLLIVYWVNQSADIGGLFAGLGISGDTLYTLGSVLLIVFLIFLFIKLKSKALFILSGIFIIAGVTNLVYETTAALAIGILLGVVAIILAIKKKHSGATSQGITPSKNIIKNKYNTRNIYNQVRQEKRAEEDKERNREKEIANLKNKSRNDEEMARQEERREEQQQQQMIAQEKRAEQQIEQKETSLISTDINSLMRSYNALNQTYNEIYNRNPSDPKLRDLMNDMIRIRDEMIRIKRGQR